MVEAIVKPSKLNEVKEALTRRASKACRIMGYSRDSFKRVHTNTGPRA